MDWSTDLGSLIHEYAYILSDVSDSLLYDVEYDSIIEEEQLSKKLMQVVGIKLFISLEFWW